MPTYFQLLLLVLPVFVLILVGVAVRRVHWIEGDAEKSLIRLVVNVCYPCLIFESVAGNAALRSPGNLLLPPLVGFGVTFLAIRAGLVVAKTIGLHVGTGLRTFALARWLPCSLELKRVIVVQAAMPTALFSIILAQLYGGHPETAVQIVLATTALGLFVIPLWLRAGLAWVGV